MNLSQPITQNTVSKIEKRLARDEDWRESALGKALALVIDTRVVSLKVLADYLLVDVRSLYRSLVSKSGQPPVRKYMPEAFDARCLQFIAALEAANADAALDIVTNWSGGDKTKSARDEAHRILLAYTPAEPQ